MTGKIPYQRIFHSFWKSHMFKQIIVRTKRVPCSLPESISSGDGKVMTRQLDSALMCEGWKLSAELYNQLAVLSPSEVKDMADRLLPIVNELVGNHVKYNVYFKDFPRNIPDTQEFWMGLISSALRSPPSFSVVAPQVATGTVNLLGLPEYGKYLHSYEEMVANHAAFIPDLKGKMKVLHLGESLQVETVKLYHQLAGSPVPLNEDDRKLIAELTELCLDDKQPEKFPVRENKALVNSVRLTNKRPLLVDTVTDVLRLACALSEGDVTLAEAKVKFKSFPRSTRRVLLSSLSGILAGNESKLLDVNRYLEQWKRLGEKLHPHESSDPLVRDMFAVARGDRKVCSQAAQAEKCMKIGAYSHAINLMQHNPGILFRSLDQVLMALQNPFLTNTLELQNELSLAIRRSVSKVSGRVLIGVWEHLLNGTARTSRRLFANTKGTVWTATEERKGLQIHLVEEYIQVICSELKLRFSKMGIDALQVDPDAFRVALPLSEKNKSSGFGVLPRGSVIPVHGETLRFFIHWKQKSTRTDFDLAAFFLNEQFQDAGHLSWTSLNAGKGSGDFVYSGDITSAPNGASEFIDMKLSKVTAPYIVAQVNRYAGDNFQDAEESFFGFMERSEAQKGKPFEAQTVKVKAEVRGKGQVAMPALFFRDSNGAWFCKWLDMQLAGRPSMNTIEGNKLTTSMLFMAIMERKNLTIQDLAALLPGSQDASRTAYVGFQKPENLNPGIAKVFTLDNLTALIPE